MPTLKAPKAVNNGWELELNELEERLERLRQALSTQTVKAKRDSSVGELRAQLRDARAQVQSLKSQVAQANRESELLADELAQTQEELAGARRNWQRQERELTRELDIAKLMLSEALGGEPRQSLMIKREALEDAASAPTRSQRTPRNVSRAAIPTVRPPAKKTGNGNG